MILRLAALAAVAVLLLATVGSAQTAAELFQKGIYTQQTAGDADGAIEIYRQVIGMAGADRAMAARAQMQLVSAFLQKGDFPGAAREFNTLALNYGDQKEVVSAMTMAMRMAASMRVATAQAPSTPPMLTKGTLENGVYHHTKTGTEIRLPAGWSVTGDGDSSGTGEAVTLRDDSGQSYFVFMVPDPRSLAEIPATLDHDVDYKLHQRVVDGVAGFKMRSGSLMKWAQGNWQAASVAFEFGQDGQQIEYDTWVRTEKTMVYFRGICPASGVYGLQDRMQILVVGATTVP